MHFKNCTQDNADQSLPENVIKMWWHLNLYLAQLLFDLNLPDDNAGNIPHCNDDIVTIAHLQPLPWIQASESTS